MKELTVTEKELQDLIFLALKDGRFEPFITSEENRTIVFTDALKIAAKRIVDQFISNKNN